MHNIQPQNVALTSSTVTTPDAFQNHVYVINLRTVWIRKMKKTVVVQRVNFSVTRASVFIKNLYVMVGMTVQTVMMKSTTVVSIGLYSTESPNNPIIMNKSLQNITDYRYCQILLPLQIQNHPSVLI